MIVRERVMVFSMTGLRIFRFLDHLPRHISSSMKQENQNPPDRYLKTSMKHGSRTLERPGGSLVAGRCKNSLRQSQWSSIRESGNGLVTRHPYCNRFKKLQESTDGLYRVDLWRS